MAAMKEAPMTDPTPPTTPVSILDRPVLMWERCEYCSRLRPIASMVRDSIAGRGWRCSPLCFRISKEAK